MRQRKLTSLTYSEQFSVVMVTGNMVAPVPLRRRAVPYVWNINPFTMRCIMTGEVFQCWNLAGWLGLWPKPQS